MGHHSNQTTKTARLVRAIWAQRESTSEGRLLLQSTMLERSQARKSGTPNARLGCSPRLCPSRTSVPSCSLRPRSCHRPLTSNTYRSGSSQDPGALTGLASVWRLMEISPFWTG
eukprot:1480233-Amphidinium_carterae.1